MVNYIFNINGEELSVINVYNFLTSFKKEFKIDISYFYNKKYLNLEQFICFLKNSERITDIYYKHHFLDFELGNKDQENHILSDDNTIKKFYELLRKTIKEDFIYNDEDTDKILTFLISSYYVSTILDTKDILIDIVLKDIADFLEEEKYVIIRKGINNYFSLSLSSKNNITKYTTRGWFLELSSHKDFDFMKIETGEGKVLSLIEAFVYDFCLYEETINEDTEIFRLSDGIGMNTYKKEIVEELLDELEALNQDEDILSRILRLRENLGIKE